MRGSPGDGACPDIGSVNSMKTSTFSDDQRVRDDGRLAELGASLSGSMAVSVALASSRRSGATACGRTASGDDRGGKGRDW